MEEKKNKQPYIIPPAYKKLVESLSQKDSATSSVSEDIPETSKEEKEVPSKTAVESQEPPKISLAESRNSRSSGLSLSSIRKRKEMLESRVEKVIDPNNLPKKPFTQEEMIFAWREYGAKQDKKGEKIVGSMFAMNTPTLDGITICLELPNESMKVDMEAAQSGLLQYMYREMENFSIEMKITVNEQASKRHAFTPQDKYEKLKEINPLIDKLRVSFDLEL